MNELKEAVLEREGCPLHYWVGGPTGAPLVVFTHGAYIDHREWNPTLPLVMAAGFRVMTWDVRSHGQSRPGVFKLSTALDDLLAILDVMKVDQATGLCGGTVVAMRRKSPVRRRRSRFGSESQ